MLKFSNFQFLLPEFLNSWVLRGVQTRDFDVDLQFEHKGKHTRKRTRDTQDQLKGIARKRNAKISHRAAVEPAQHMIFARLPPHASFEKTFTSQSKFKSREPKRQALDQVQV